MKLKNKKAQIITFDFGTSLIVFLIVLVIVIGVFLFSQTTDKTYDFELEYVFGNLENNLQYETANNRDFFKEYRVDSEKLDAFALYVGTTGSVDDYVVGNISSAHGIGLSSEAYDVCLYFTNNTGLPMPFSGVEALGQVKSGSCDNVIKNRINPCEDYKQALSLLKPVLLDTGN